MKTNSLLKMYNCFEIGINTNLNNNSNNNFINSNNNLNSSRDSLPKIKSCKNTILSKHRIGRFPLMSSKYPTRLKKNNNVLSLNIANSMKIKSAKTPPKKLTKKLIQLFTPKNENKKYNPILNKIYENNKEIQKNNTSMKDFGFSVNFELNKYLNETNNEKNEIKNKKLIKSCSQPQHWNYSFNNNKKKINFYKHSSYKQLLIKSLINIKSPNIIEGWNKPRVIKIIEKNKKFEEEVIIRPWRYFPNLYKDYLY